MLKERNGSDLEMVVHLVYQHQKSSWTLIPKQNPAPGGILEETGLNTIFKNRNLNFWLTRDKNSVPKEKNISSLHRYIFFLTRKEILSVSLELLV